MRLGRPTPGAPAAYPVQEQAFLQLSPKLDQTREAQHQKWFKVGLSGHIATKSAVSLAYAGPMPPARFAHPARTRTGHVVAPFIAAGGSHPSEIRRWRERHVCQSGARLAHDARRGYRGKGPADRVVQVVRPSGGARSRRDGCSIRRRHQRPRLVHELARTRIRISLSPGGGPRSSAARSRQYCRSGRCDRLPPVPPSNCSRRSVFPWAPPRCRGHAASLANFPI